MRHIALTRLVTFILLFSCMSFIPLKLNFSIFYALLQGHFLAAYIYSYKNINTSLKNFRTLPWFVLILLFSISYWTPYFPLEIFFGVHFVFSEIYLQQFRKISNLQRLFRYIITISIYLILVGPSKYLSWIPIHILYFSISLSLLFLIWIAVRDKNKLSWNLVTYEAMGSLFVFLLPPANILLINVLYFHLFWWILYSFKELSFSWNKKLLFFCAINLGLPAIIFIFTPYPKFFNVSTTTWEGINLLNGLLHITLALVISKSNPDILNRFFQPSVS